MSFENVILILGILLIWSYMFYRIVLRPDEVTTTITRVYIKRK